MFKKFPQNACDAYESAGAFSTSAISSRVWKTAFCILLALATTAPALASDESKQKTQPSYALSAEGSITIDINGLVREYQLGPNEEITPEIASILDRGIKKWRFEPILVEGRPVNARTSMRLEVDIHPYQDGYHLKIASVSFGYPSHKEKSPKPPLYPQLAERARIEAQVVLVLALDANGEVIRAIPERVSLSGTGREKVIQEWRQIFEDSAVAAAKRWKFKINETVADKNQEETLIRIPVEYRLGEESHWLALYPVKMPPRILPKPVPSQKQELKHGEFENLTSSFKPKDEIVGTSL